MTGPQPTPGMDLHAFDGETPGDLELQRLVTQAQAAMQWRAEVDALTGHGRSADGVEVEVSASGGVVDVRVPDAACDRGGAAVTAQVLDAVQAAQEDLARQLRRSSADRFGEDSPAARTVAASTETRFARAAVLPEDPDAGRR